MTYKDKLQQANKEAKSAVVALFLTVLVWIISGFGVAQFNITLLYGLSRGVLELGFLRLLPQSL